MTILLIGNYLYDRQYSMLGFHSLLESMLRATDHKVRGARPLAFPVFRNSQRGCGKWIAYFSKFLLFPLLLRKMRASADVVHVCDHAYSPYSLVLQGTPHVVTCHDLISIRGALGEFADRRTRSSGRVYQKMIVRGLTSAQHVACVSEATREELLRITQLPRDRVSVVYNGLSRSFVPVIGEQRSSIFRRLCIPDDQRYILHVGSSAWYKNRIGVVRIFSKLVRYRETQDFCLIFAGSDDSTDIARAIDEGGINRKVRVFRAVEPYDLRALYSGATALLFPSFVEGFGLPIIEAQACGCPVFTSNRTPMTEIGRDAAVYIDPEDYDQAVDVIRENLPHLSAIREAGFVNVKQFSAQQMVLKYIDLYNRLVTAPPSIYGRPSPSMNV